jgi:hypothetical protein
MVETAEPPEGGDPGDWGIPVAVHTRAAEGGGMHQKTLFGAPARGLEERIRYRARRDGVHQR